MERRITHQSCCDYVEQITASVRMMQEWRVVVGNEKATVEMRGCALAILFVVDNERVVKIVEEFNLGVGGVDVKPVIEVCNRIIDMWKAAVG